MLVYIFSEDYRNGSIDHFTCKGEYGRVDTCNHFLPFGCSCISYLSPFIGRSKRLRLCNIVSRHGVESYRYGDHRRHILIDICKYSIFRGYIHIEVIRADCLTVRLGKHLDNL